MVSFISVIMSFALLELRELSKVNVKGLCRMLLVKFLQKGSMAQARQWLSRQDHKYSQSQ